MTLQNTTVAENTAGSGSDCWGTIGSAGYNLVGDTSGCTLTLGPGDLTDVDTHLGLLVGAPGVPRYHPLLSGSPAIDTGNPAGCTDHLGNPLGTDQRGAARVGRCDIGAYEYTTPGPAASVSAVGGTPQRTLPSSAFGKPLQAAVLDSIGSPVNNVTVTFSAPASGASGTFADTGTFTTTGVTDEGSVATAATFTANALEGSYVVTATVGGVVTAANFLLANIGWYVSPSGNDDNDCLSAGTACATINGALNKPGFVGKDTIRVAAGTYTGSGDEVVLLNKDATLSGGWDTTFTTQSGTSTIDGEGSRRGITISGGVIATIEHFTVQNGSTGVGGGIFNRTGILTLNDSTVSGNTSQYSAGGINNEEGTLTLNNSTVTGNSTQSYGGGIAHGYGDLTLNNSTVSDNTAGGEGGGISNDRGTVTLNNSTVDGNEASSRGGGIRNYFGTITLNSSAVTGNTTVGGIWDIEYCGGGIYNWTSILILNNSTVSGNTASGDGGGIYHTTSVGGGVYSVMISNSTVSDNKANLGGGIYRGEGPATVQNTIVAGNTAVTSGPDCWGSISSAGYSLVGDTSGCAYTPGSGDLTNVDPRIGPLEGSPGYHPLLPDSPAINAGNPAGCTDHLGNPLTTDQRGFPRFGRCDIGAYELQPIGFSTKTVNQSTASPGDSLVYTIALSNGGATNITNVRGTDALPIFLTYIDNSLTATSGNYGYSNGVITWTGSVNVGEMVTITFGAKVGQTLGFVVNSAVISGGGEIITRTATINVVGQICNIIKHPGNPILSVGAVGSWDDDSVWDPAILKEGMLYKMWYTGDDGSGPSRIGLATSTDGVNWTKDTNNPVLSPSETWEAEGVRAASVISDSGLYEMWYTGHDSSGVGRIGYATSSDGVTWTKHGGSPVLDVGSSGSWEDDDVMKPTVIRQGGTYHMWYEGYDGMTSRIGHATSSDGINWIKDPANPVLDVGPPGGWDWLYAYGPSVVAYGDVYLLWYSGGTLPLAWQTGYALSFNDSTWTRGGMLIREGAPGTFDVNGADYPSVIVDGASFKVWYTGMDDGGAYNIGYATAEICGTPSNPIYLPIVMRNWSLCPAYYTDDFSDPGSGWPVYDDSDVRFAYTDGQYQIWLKKPSLGWPVTPGAKAADFTVAVSARRTSGDYGVYGIIFGLNEDWSELYQIDIAANYYSIWRYDKGSWTVLRDWTSSGHIATGTSWNRLKVIRNGANIALYANDQHLATVTDGSFTGLRRIGLVAISPSSGPLDARFDDFSLYPASCGVSAAAVGFEMGEPDIHDVPVPPGLDQSP